MTNSNTTYFNVINPEKYEEFQTIFKIKKQTFIFLNGEIGSGKS